jgi:hypothetical protein
MKDKIQRSKYPRVTVYMKPELARKAKAYAIREGKSLVEVIEESLERQLPREVVVTSEG